MLEFSISNDISHFVEQFNKEKDIFAYVLVNDEEKAIGLIQFQKIELVNSLLKEELGFVREFWIASESRKKGYGSKLLKKAEDYLSQLGMESVILFSRSEAETFYQKQGYRKRKDMTSCNGMAVWEKTKK